MAFVCALGGTFLVLLILMDAFEAMVLPRRISRRYRPTRLYYRLCWKTCCALVDRTSSLRIRKALLGAFGPLSLFGLFGVWAAGLVIGFGLLHQAVAPSDRALSDSLYLSGTTFTTLGYGDVNPIGVAARLLSIVEALVGFGFLAVVIGFLPVFYQAFSHRELSIALLDARAGSPPSAGQMLLRLPPRHGGALNRFLEQAEHWSAAVLESHLSYPVLSYYRSQHDNQSWLAAITCMLDACALLLTVAEGADRQQARLTFAMARHTIVDLALVLRRAPQVSEDRLPPATLDRLLAALRAVGVTVRDDATTRAKLIELRDLYEPFANSLASQLRLDLPPAWREDSGADNWQTTAWARKAAGFTNLGSESRDDHDD